MPRDRNQMPIVHPSDDDLNIVRVGHYQDQYSTRYRRYVVECAQCGEWFLTKRPHTLYCSCACKQRSYRERAL